MKMANINPKYATVILLMVAFIWGTTFVLVENAIAWLPPFLFNAIRFWIASFALYLVLKHYYKLDLKQLGMKCVLAGAFLGLFLFGGYFFQTLGLLYTTSSKAAFITGLSVVLVPLLAFFLLKQRFKINAIIGVLLATGGLYFLSFIDMTSLSKGDAFVLICAFCFGLQIIFTSKYAGTYSTLGLAWVQITTVAVLCTIGAAGFGEWTILYQHPHFLLEPAVLFALLICALPATVFAFVAQTELQRVVSPTKVALVFAMEPVFAALTDYIWTGRHLTWHELLGCLLILVGMILAESQWKKWRKRRKQDYEEAI